MSNPFQFFANDQEEQQYQQVPSEQKPKRTHAEKKAYKQQQENNKKNTNTSAPVLTQQLPQKHKQNAKQIRNPRHPPTPVTKKLGEGHYHDRRSGTGRVDKVRKAGGGKGNVGNVKDDLNPDKYIKQTQQENQPVPAQNQNQKPSEQVQEQVKEQEPEALTLEEYYKNKGVDVSSTFQQKGPNKKGQVSAEWIKKEKLTVMETKEDKRQGEIKPQNSVKFSDTRGEVDESLNVLGFNSRSVKSQKEQKEQRGGRRKKQKVVLNQQDFPSL